MSEASGIYVSRGGDKLASVAVTLGIDFRGKTVLDIGSSTGGFTDYALQHAAKKIIAVEKGTNQLHPRLHGDKRIELHEKTDIRDIQINEPIDLILMDLSFVSLRDILGAVRKFCGPTTIVLAMVKPQFEASRDKLNRGVVKNETIRRQVLKDFEAWVQKQFIIEAKSDSSVVGNKGNKERFYKLRSVDS